MTDTTPTPRDAPCMPPNLVALIHEASDLIGAATVKPRTPTAAAVDWHVRSFRWFDAAEPILKETTRDGHPDPNTP